MAKLFYPNKKNQSKDMEFVNCLGTYLWEYTNFIEKS